MKPQVIVGSSQEAIDYAYAVQQNLEHVAEVTVWDQGIFELSGNTLDSLICALDSADFGVFIFSPDDVARIRTVEFRIPRDNVIFEFGLSVGRLGRDRSFVIAPHGGGTHLLSDLAGFTTGRFYAPRESGTLRAALSSVCTDIRTLITAKGPMRSELLAKERIDDAWKDLLHGATRSVWIASGDASWAERDQEVLQQKVLNGIPVHVLAPRPTLATMGNIERLLDAGADVRFSSTETPVRGLLVDCDNVGFGFALRIERTATVDGNTYNARRYNPIYHKFEIDSLSRLFVSQFNISSKATMLKEKTTLSDHERLGYLVRSGVSQFSQLQLGDVSVRSLVLEDLWSPCKFVKADRLERVKVIHDAYHGHGVPLFRPVTCVSAGPSGPLNATLLPPIVEERGDGKFVVIDGMHRLFLSLVDGNAGNRGSVECLVLRSDVPLPSETIPLRQVSVVPFKRPSGPCLT